VAPATFWTVPLTRSPAGIAVLAFASELADPPDPVLAGDVGPACRVTATGVRMAGLLGAVAVGAGAAHAATVKTRVVPRVASRGRGVIYIEVSGVPKVARADRDEPRGCTTSPYFRYAAVLPLDGGAERSTAVS